ncbi:MAG TPA: TIM barrel protein [Armatimonadota bacterium]|jgi:hydroxypyruvate isomerase
MKQNVKLSACIEMCVPGVPFVDRLDVAAKAGIPAVEFWGWGGKDIDAIGKRAKDLGLEVAIFGAGGSQPTGDLKLPESRDGFVAAVRESIGVARKLGVDRLICTTGNEIAELPRQQQHDALVGNLKAAAPVLEGEGITLCLEPLNVLVDHAGYYLVTSVEGFQICREVGSPRVKLLYDIYHQQISEGFLIPTITANIDLIGHFHAADVPGRYEPGTGEINYANVFAAIGKTSYDGYVGLEYRPTGDAEACLRKVVEINAAA